MPHIIIEHSLNSFKAQNTANLLKEIHHVVETSNLFNRDNIKIRLHKVDDFLLDCEYQHFIHVQCRVHIGRTQNQQQELTTRLVDSLAKFARPQTVITCEIVEMNRDSYRKAIIN